MLSIYFLSSYYIYAMLSLGRKDSNTADIKNRL